MEISRVAPTGRFNRFLFLKPAFKNWKLFILLASYSFLGFKILTFHQYQEFATQWKQMPLSQLWWLVGIFILLPLNWILEALKWKILTFHVQKMNLFTSVKAVLSGISTGFFTPNRIGELVGRISFLEADNRKSGVTLSIVNSLTQNIIMAICGIPSCILFFSFTAGKMQPDMTHFVLILLICILFFGFIYFTLPLWSRQLEKSRLSGSIKTFTDCLSNYKLKDLMQIMSVSLVRYLVFCTQFYFTLLFFGIDLNLQQALLAIPTCYLFVTFTPSIAFSEAAVRSSYAVLIIGAFSGQVVNIALAGICIWAINFVIPMLVGAIVLVRKND